MTMKIDLQNLNPGTFFPFEDGEEGEGITLRVLTSEVLNEIFKRTQVRKAEVKGNPPTRFEFAEYKKNGQDKEFEMTWDYCIVDWKGVVDTNGEEIPCTTENKYLLMRQCPDFFGFVTKCLEELNKMAGLYEQDLD